MVEWYLYLAASTLYAISTILFILSFVFKKETWIRSAISVAFLGLLLHSVSLGFRWVEAGHGPYYTMFEALSSIAWANVAIFLVLQYRIQKIRYAGIMVMAVSLLMMGVGATTSTEIMVIPPSLRSYWLIVHIGFAKLAFGFLLIATGLAMLYLLNENYSRNENSNLSMFYNRLPDMESMDDLMYQFVIGGFLFLSVMIASGSIWAYQTWGRYWAWDPIETWSLISWLVYGIYLHQRRNVGWRGKKAAWLLIVGLIVLAFSLLGAGIVYKGLHSAYLVQ